MINEDINLLKSLKSGLIRNKSSISLCLSSSSSPDINPIFTAASKELFFCSCYKSPWGSAARAQGQL